MQMWNGSSELPRTDRFPKMRKFLNAESLALLGLGLYAALSVLYAHTITPNLDEGSYLLKGYLFASGAYVPYGVGIAAGKSPLAFLIPGYALLLFGPGLRAGRYLAVVFGILTVIGVWATARRLVGSWAAAAAVWAFTLSPMVIKIYSEAVSEAIVACGMAWMFYLCLGKDRRLGHLVGAGLLAGLAVMTRQNMAPILFLLVGYISWEYGWKRGGWTFLAASSVVILFHVMYWPHILQIWAEWAPEWLAPFVAQEYPLRGLQLSWTLTSVDAMSRAVAFFQGVRLQFIAVVGSGVALLLWARRSTWPSAPQWRAAVFLAATYVGFFLLHAWASVGKNYCIFCFSSYLAFFNPAGILLIVVSRPAWDPRPSRLRSLLALLFLLILATGLGLAAFEEIGLPVLNMPIPRLKSGQILPGTTSLWEALSQKTSLPLSLARKLAAIGAGGAAAIAILLVVYFLWRRFYRGRISYGFLLLNGVLLFGLLFSPVLIGPARGLNCDRDVIAMNEQVGSYLARIVPPGSRVYWAGGLSAVPLLYIPSARLYPAQINGGYTFAHDGDAQTLLQAGYWNEELRSEWIASADIFIVSEENYPSWKGFFSADRFQEFDRSPVATSCEAGSRLRVFKRIRP